MESLHSKHSVVVLITPVAEPPSQRGSVPPPSSPMREELWPSPFFTEAWPLVTQHMAEPADSLASGPDHSVVLTAFSRRQTIVVSYSDNLGKQEDYSAVKGTQPHCHSSSAQLLNYSLGLKFPFVTLTELFL